MAKNPIEKEKQNNSNTPGAGLSKSEAAIKKTKEITDKINNISNKVQIGTTMALFGRDSIQVLKTLSNMTEEESYEVRQALKKEAKDEAIKRIYEALPTEQEIIDKLLGYSCELIVIKAAKKTKSVLEDNLNKGKEIAENVVKRLDKLQKKMEKASTHIITITTILAVFQALVIAFEILIIAATLALNFFTSLFSSAGLEKVINDSIAKAKAFVLKYTEAIKGFTTKCLKVLNTVMIIFNLIPKIIKIFSTLITMIVGFLALINKLFEEYIGGCINKGELVIENSDGTLTNNLELLDNFLNSNLGDNNNGTSPDIYDNYTYDQGDNRIYKPKKN